MPELPEVETLRRGMEKSLVGRTIIGCEIANPKVLQGQDKSTFEERVAGQRIARVDRRGKYLLIALAGDAETAALQSDSASATKTPSITLCIHLKMRGQLRLQLLNEPIGPYHCVSLLLDNDVAVRFYDMWTWGEMRALTTGELSQVATLSRMGPEPLDADWDAARLESRLKGRRGPIKPALLDQKVIAGVGNIYADESLFRAGIHPQRAADTLSETELIELATTLRMVLSEAVHEGGTLSEEFTDMQGLAGRFVPQVYDRGGEPCPVCKTPLTRIKLGGRGTVFCTHCQPGESVSAPDDRTET